MSWYRTYRPQRIEQLHLVDVRTQLQNMLKSGELPQSFLFTGPKGTGKTSSARILAKVFNCSENKNHKKGKAYSEPCGSCDQCIAILSGSAMNVIEIDAASHRGIDNIRELREQVYYPPAQGEKLIYIIDEVHMLTKEAFNALLKILEEPPSHAVFILATTESQKVIDTIVSRCTVVQFKTASNQEIQDSLVSIATKEKLKVDKDVWPIITQHAQGSFRDAVKLFEQVVRQIPAGESISADKVLLQLVSFSSSDAERLIQSVLAKDEIKIATFFQDISSRQFDAKYLHTQLLSFLHTELLKGLKVTPGTPIAPVPVLQFLLKQLSLVVIDDRSAFPWLSLELCLLEMVLKSKAQKTEAKVSVESGPSVSRQSSKVQEINTVSVKKNEVQQVAVTVTSDEIEIEEKTTTTFAQNPIPDVIEHVTPIVNTASADVQLISGTQLGEQWQPFLKIVGQKNLSLEALLRSSKFVKGEHGKATIQVFYKFHKEQLELDRHRRLIEECVITHLGGLVKVEFVLASSTEKIINTKDDNVSGKVEEAEGLVKLAEEALL